ncbi:MAG: M48 family metallopeptidase [Natrialbaceae archaeon]
MRPSVRFFQVLVGIAVLFVHTVVAVGGLLLIDWLVSNPPNPAVVAVSFAVVAVLGALVGYRSGVVQVAARLDATELPEHHAPALYRRIRELTGHMDIEPPTVLLADLGAPNALSVGGPKRGAVVLDRRLLTLLNHDELEAIVAHELAHMEGYDTFLNTLALTVIRLLVSVVFVLALPFVVFLAGVDRAGAWIVGDPRRRGFGLSDLFQRLVALCLVGLLSVVTLLFLANSRRQEYRADERAGEVTGKPAALARALTKIHRATDPRRGLYSPLYVHDDPRPDRHRLFSTHPPVSERVDRLVERADDSGGVVRRLPTEGR